LNIADFSICLIAAPSKTILVIAGFLDLASEIFSKDVIRSLLYPSRDSLCTSENVEGYT
jgi:hypothetical protein